MKTTFFTAAALLATSTMAFPLGRVESTKRATQPTTRDDAAGVMLMADAKNPFTTVSAQFTVPEAKGPASASGSGPYTADIWTGLGMDANKDFKSPKNSSLIRAGIRVSVGNDKTATYNAFYDILPDLNVLVNSTAFNVKAGDSVFTEVALKLNDQGEPISIDLSFKNGRTGQTDGRSLSNESPDSTSSMMGGNADFVVSGDSSKLANFGSVDFSIVELAAREPFGGNGTGVSDLLDNAMILSMATGGKTLASAKVLNASAVSVNYSGA